MLRKGRMVETGDLEVLRRLAAVKVEAVLLGDAPDLSHVDGVDHVEVEGRTLRCHVTGPMGPLLAVLAHVGVERLMTREPSLEELFMAHYEDVHPGARVS
jgi:ABC-2 type transport system ATP-binding protein